MGRSAIAAGVSFALSCLIGYVTSVVTAHPTTGALAGLGGLVVLGIAAAVVQNLPDSRRGKKSAADSSGGQPASAMPIDYAAGVPTEIFEAVDVDGFTGREWLVRELDAFMAAKPCGYFLVEADAGMGKTAFAAWLVKTRGYLFHFSRSPGGRLTRGALQSLAAQVIRKFRLTDVTQEGFVAEWALSATGFQSLLSQAASRLGAKGSLVLVVDGLDEAEPVPDGMPFGLPVLLPPRVYVVATFRTGGAPPHVEPSKKVRISQDDPANIGDIRGYLAKAAAAEPLAGRLAAAHMSKAAFVDLLTPRCKGVWVYLRYVLSEIRDGSRLPGAIADLPAGLQAYYASQFDGWRRAPDWADGLLPLLATLGVADEALSAATLAELAGGQDQARVRRWCGTTLLPLLTISTPAVPTGQAAASPTSGDERLFAIYHASLREVLRGDTPKGTEGAPLEDALELRQATVAAHSRICDRYLLLFGGLDAGLAKLAGDPALGQVDGGYPLRHLTRHLSQAERADDLTRLLRAEHPADGPAGQQEVGSRADNVWYLAQDAADYLGHYLDDLHRAGGIAAETTDRAAARRAVAPSLGQEIAYALMAASIVSRTKNVPPALVQRAVETGVWSAERGLDHARRLPDAGDRVQALLAIQPRLAAGERPGVLAEALANARDIPDQGSRLRALARVAASLPANQQAEVFREALAIAATQEPDHLASALRAMAPRLPADMRPEALRLASSITDPRARVDALTGLVPFLGPQEQRQAINAALDADRAQYGDVAGHWAGPVDEVFRGKTLAAFAPQLPPDLLNEALLLAAKLPDGGDRAGALTALAPRVAESNRPGVVEQARQAALTIEYDTSRFKALIALAPLLPNGQRRDALRQALDGAAAEWDLTRMELLVAMAPALPSDLLADAHTMAEGIAGDGYRVRALAGLADSLPAEQRPGLLRQAVDALKTDKWLLEREALSDLVPHLPSDLLTEVLDLVIAGPYDDFRVRALRALAPYLPPDLLARCLAAVAISDDFGRAGTLRVLARYLPEDDHRAVQRIAMETTFAITEFNARREQLDLLLPVLHPGLLDQAVAACEAMDDDGYRPKALTCLAIGRPGAGRDDILDKALDAARHATNPSIRAGLLPALARKLPEDRRTEVMAEVLAAVPEIDHAGSRATALANLGGDLAADQLARAVTMAAAIDDPAYRAEALTGLARSAPAGREPGLLDEALAAATAIDDDRARVKALVALAPALPDSRRADALGRALDAALADEFDRSEQLTLIASLLSPPLLAEAVATVSARQYGPDARELAALAPFLPDGQRQDVLRQALEAAGRTGFTDDALAVLAPQLPPDLLSKAVTIARDIHYDATRVKTLAALGARLPDGQQEAVFREALRDASAMERDFDVANTWRAIAAPLPVGLLAEAIALAPKSSSESAAAVLYRAARVLPEDGVGDYLQLLRAALTGLDRGGCMHVVASTAEVISSIGGDVAIKRCADAICDAERWWP
jgi:hypothetical protein